jgi:hypothetical protein
MEADIRIIVATFTGLINSPYGRLGTSRSRPANRGRTRRLPAYREGRPRTRLWLASRPLPRALEPLLFAQMLPNGW